MAGLYLRYKKLKKNNMANKSIHDYPEEQENDDNKAPGFKNLQPDDRDDNEDEIVMGTEADVTPEDLELLGDKDQDMDGGDDETTGNAKVDDTDADGDKLNGADDLDVPGSELDDDNEDIGEEDEENNYYSQSDNQDKD